MDQEKLQIFIMSISEYFKKITGLSIETGVPFFKEEGKNVLLNYTGVIGISGKMKGAVYITAGEKFFSDLLEKIMPGMAKTDKRLSGMAGELANTIAGNAQKTLGKEFLISIPMILTNSGDSSNNTFELQAPTFIIPLKWLDNEAFLVVGLK